MTKYMNTAGTLLDISTTAFDPEIPLDSTIIEGATYLSYKPIVKGFNIEGIQTDQVEVTTIANEKVKSYAPVLSEPGEITGETHYKKNNAEQVLLDASIAADDYRIVRVTFNDGSVMASYGFIKGQPINLGLNEKVGSNLSIQLSGEPVWTVGVEA